MIMSLNDYLPVLEVVAAPYQFPLHTRSPDQWEAELVSFSDQSETSTTDWGGVARARRSASWSRRSPDHLAPGAGGWGTGAGVISCPLGPGVCPPHPPDCHHSPESFSCSSPPRSHPRYYSPSPLCSPPLRLLRPRRVRRREKLALAQNWSFIFKFMKAFLSINSSVREGLKKK